MQVVEIDIYTCTECKFECLHDRPTCMVCFMKKKVQPMESEHLLENRRLRDIISRAGTALEMRPLLSGVPEAEKACRQEAYKILEESGIEWEVLC